MEGRDVSKADASRSGKRPLESRLSSGGDNLPRKLKPLTSTPAMTPSAVNSYFQMESRVHDVEEHFRRSLESIQSSKNQHGNNNKLESEPHQIVIRENQPHISRATPSPSLTTSSPTRITSRQRPFESQDGVIRMVSPPLSNINNAQQQNSVVPPPPLLLNLPGASNSPKPESMKSYNEVLSLAATQQYLTAAALSQQVASGGRGILLPSVLPVSQSNFIPVMDSNGITQLVATTTANTSSIQPQGVSPILFFGAGNVPMLPAAQPGMYLLNPTTDLSSLQQQQQQQQQPSPVAPSLSTVTTTQPSYIVFPQSFNMPQSLTLEQLSALASNLHQQKQELQQVDGRHDEPTRQAESSPQGESSVPSDSGNHSIDGDSVEEHFARALGEQWKKFKKDPTTSSNKISTRQR